MIFAIEIGRGGSKGFPGKNAYKIQGIPLLAYPIMACEESEYISFIYFNTDSPELANVASRYGALVVDRPEHLATDEALGEDVFVYTYKYQREGLAEQEIEFVVLLFANAPCITGKMLDEMIETLRLAKSYDSICTVSKYNMFSPYRMRTLSLKEKDNFGFYKAESFFGMFTPLSESNCDRDSAGDFWIYDCSAAIVRPHCLGNIEQGLPPQRWLGNNIIGYRQEIPALDIDYEWQLGQIEYWLIRNSK